MKQEDNFGLKKIYEDDNLVIIFKPAGVLTIPDRYDLNLPNVSDILNSLYEKIFTCHRLDRDTSGIMVFAKTAEAHRDLSLQFQEQTVLKIYHAVLKGVVVEDHIDIDIPIAPSPIKKGASIPSARGKESLTILDVIKRYKNETLVECKLVTGRHHQLRVHTFAIGHPLLIDDFYGSAEPFLISSLKKNFKLKKHTTENPIISRITMHALKLGFHHPTTREYVEFEAEYPKDFRALIQVLDKYSKPYK